MLGNPVLPLSGASAGFLAQNAATPCLDALKMSEELFSRNQIDRFIRDEIDSVPQLEALLLFWRRFPVEWTCADLARELYVSAETAQNILRHLETRRLILKTCSAESRYALQVESEHKRNLFISLEHIYRYELIRVSKMIHANASPGLRDFARSFRFKKD